MMNANAKKAQAAMEFLMTYGWAILVVLVIIGVLVFFGVLSPSTLLLERCTFAVSITCTDHSVTASGITLILQNNAGRDMVVTGISAASEALGTGDLGQGCGTGAISAVLSNGATNTFTLSTGDVAGACNFRDVGKDKHKYNLTLSYNWFDSSALTHQMSGELLAAKP